VNDESLTCTQGSAVSVKRVFSGGRDTIGLHHASLGAETIRSLMLVKYDLCRQRQAHSPTEA
jgi:hypothetical protein